MTTDRRAAAAALDRLRTARGMSWSALAAALRETARQLRIGRIASAQQASVRRTIARWEAGTAVPDEQYRLLLAHVYARTLSP